MRVIVVALLALLTFGFIQGASAQNGLQPGDVVRGASSEQITDLAGFQASFSPKPQQLVLSIQRGNALGNLLVQ